MRSELKSKIKVLLVDDHPFVLEGIKSCLEKQKRLKIVGEATSGREAIQKTKQLKPDVVVMDVSMPMMDGLEATLRLRQANPETKVLILTMHDDRDILGQIVHSGARGYVRKNAPPAELTRAIETLHRGEVYFTADAAQTLIADYAQNRRRSIDGRSPSISDRERQVLSLIVEGLSNKEIAARLHISIRTAQKHRENIMEKVGVHKATELVKVAITRRLVNY